MIADPCPNKKPADGFSLRTLPDGVANFGTSEVNEEAADPGQVCNHIGAYNCPITHKKFQNAPTISWKRSQVQPCEKSTSGANFTEVNGSLESIYLPDNPRKISKRVLAGWMGKLFDPLGLLTPLSLLPKCLFQKTWDVPGTWDDPVSEEIIQEFFSWISNLKFLTSLHILRFVANFDGQQCELHLFCDVSELAYGAAIYA